MPGIDGSFIARAAAAATLVFALAAPAAGQSAPAFDFFTRYDFHLNAEALACSDPNFKWDAHFGGDLDLVDYGFGRGGILVDYETIVSNELRLFDPEQGNYHLEAFISGRLPRFEIVGAFHHLSQHLSDRPKEFAIAWNAPEGRILTKVPLSSSTLDIEGMLGFVVQHSYVDYTWISDGRITYRHPIAPKVALFGEGYGELIGTDETVAHRGTQTGGRVEGGVRLIGTGGVMELFAGYEKRIDADPITRQPRHWVTGGFRLLAR